MEERRQDDRKIAVLEERVTNWMESTTEYRKDLCRKIDIITTKIGELPCKSREEITKSVKKEQDKLWLFINLIIVAIVGSWIGMMIKK
jgi:hypothetical protein